MCKWGSFKKCGEINNQVLTCDGILGRLGLGESSKKSKVLKMKECGAGFWGLGPFRGGCEEGV